MNNYLLPFLLILMGSLQANAQDTSVVRSPESLVRIEISHHLMVGWFRKESKPGRAFIIENNTLYEQKRKRLVEIGPCDTLAGLLDRKKIDPVFRSNEKQCEDGYEVNVHIRYVVIDQNVETTYLYVFSTQAHCKEEASSAYLRRIQAELHKCRER